MWWPATAPLVWWPDPAIPVWRAMMVFGMLRSWLAGPTVGLDIGTAWVRGVGAGGRTVAEPALVLAETVRARDGRRTRRTVAVGAAAARGLEELRPDRFAVRPVRHGVLADAESGAELFGPLLAAWRTGLRRPVGLVVATVPAGASPVERAAILAALTRAGGQRSVVLVESPLVAAIGAGLPVEEPRASLIANIGAGMTEIALVSLGGILAARSERVGGDDMDRAVALHLRRSFRLTVDGRTAERVKQAVTGAGPCNPDSVERLRIGGRDIVSGRPRSVEVGEADMVGALDLPVLRIVESVREFLEETATEAGAGLDFDTLVLTGGGALLPGLDRAIEWATGMRTRVADDPAQASVRGLATLLVSGGRIGRGKGRMAA